MTTASADDPEERQDIPRRRFLQAAGVVTASVTLPTVLSATSSGAGRVPRAMGDTTSLVGPFNLRFRGAWTLPVTVAGEDASWGGALVLRTVGGERRFFAATVKETVYEVRFPGLGWTPPFPVAPVVRTWGDVTAGSRLLDGRPGGGSLYGLYWDAPDRRLYWSYGDGYNTRSAHDPSVGYSLLDDRAGALAVRRVSPRSVVASRVPVGVVQERERAAAEHGPAPGHEAARIRRSL